MNQAGKSPVVALLTDLGTVDTYVGVMKAVILGLCPTARIVDLCHGIAPQDIQQAGFLLDTAWRYFPKGTVHLVVVDPGVGTERRVVAVEVHGQQFVAPDNGVLTYVLAGARDYEAFVVERREHFLSEITQTFHGRDILAPVAARLADGMPIEAVGREVEEPLKRLPLPRPIAGEAGLEVHVIHVDRFGNLVTDLLEPDLRVWQEEIGGEEIVIAVGEDAISEISETYAGAEPGELLAVFGSTGRLEIAVNQGSAAERLGLERGAIVVIMPRS